MLSYELLEGKKNLKYKIDFFVTVRGFGWFEMRRDVGVNEMIYLKVIGYFLYKYNVLVTVL